MKRDKDREVRIFIYIALIITLFLPSPAERFGEQEEQTEPPAVTATAEYREQRPLYDVPLSAEIQRYIFNVSDYYGVDPALVLAVIERESGYNSAAIGDSGDSIGLMQIQPRWHAARMDKLGVDDLFNPYENVSLGVDILASYIDEGHGEEWALHAYNGGVAYANRMSVADEVSDYAKSIIDRANNLKEENE